ncbi:CAP domain-containing protein [Rhodoblastus sp.]|uniref:CAP domain-containing protein n=1 Tax=Rhodoblastus sp. TaxID=1962975 RepID=UPI003F9DBCDD
MNALKNPTLLGRLLFAVAPAGLLLASCADTPVVAPPTPQRAPTFYDSMAAPGARLDADSARDMISLYRSNHGLDALTVDPGLMAEAQAQAEAMARSDKLSHEVRGTLTARLNRAGYRKSRAVENVSAGYHTLAEAFSGWRQSPPHNANMLAPGMRRMGIAAAYNPNAHYKVFWTLVLAD